MEGLLVIILIAVAFFRVFGKFTRLKEKLPEDWKEQRLPPVFKDLGFPWSLPGEEIPETRGQRPVLRQRPEVGRRAARFAPKVTETVTETPELMNRPETIEPLGSPSVPVAMQGDYSQPELQHPMQDKQALLNGIIFSEVLNPPRSRRGWRSRQR